MQSTIRVHDDGKSAVTVAKHDEVKRGLKFLPKEKAKSFVKKRALHVVTFTDVDGEEADFVMRRLSPSEFGIIFGSILGKTSIDAIGKVDNIDESEVESIVRKDLEKQIEEDERTLDEITGEMQDKITEAIFKCMFYPPETPEEYIWTREEIVEMDEEMRDDLFKFTTRGVTGSGDSVDSFSPMDETTEESGASDSS